MKTTVEIPDPLFRQVKALAAKEGTSVKAVIERALRQMMQTRKRPTKPFKLKDCSFKGEGLQDGLTWDDWDKIREMSYEGRGG